MSQDHKNIERPESDCPYHAEIHRPAYLHVIPNKAQPVARSIFRTSPSWHVLPHRPDIKVVESQINQDIPYLFCTPQRIFPADPPNHLPQFYRDSFPANFAPGFPSPKKLKRFLLPGHNRSWLHHMTDPLPSVPQPGKGHPEKSERIRKSIQALSVASSQAAIQLTFQCDNPGSSPGPGQENKANENPISPVWAEGGGVWLAIYSYDGVAYRRRYLKKIQGNRLPRYQFVGRADTTYYISITPATEVTGGYSIQWTAWAIR
jgi:hypothetical protein